MDMSQYLDIFIEESREHLQSLSQCLLELEKNPNEKSMLNEIFRVAHTLKGMSGTMGFMKMSKLTHAMEDVLSVLRNGELEVNSKLMDILFKCLDALEGYIENIVEKKDEGDNEYAELVKKLKDSINKSEPEVKSSKPDTKNVKRTNALSQSGMILVNEYELNVIIKAKEMGINVYQITIHINPSCIMKSARSFIIFQAIERYSEIIKSVPTVEDIEEEKFEFDFTVIVVSKESLELMSKEINSIAEVDKVDIVKYEPNTSDVDVQRATDSQSNGTVTEIHDKSVDTNKEGTNKNLGLQKAGKTVRVDIDRLDFLMNLVSELIIVKTRLDGLSASLKVPDLGESLEYLERVSTNLHEAVMKVRMVPVETVFNRFPRMIRDVSKSIGKEIVLNMTGQETELDRSVIDEIGDPLIHLLRNSADHGIESSEIRKEAGKPEVGTISLKAYHDGNSVVIEVEDDGQGINTNKVKNKIIEKGILSQEAADNLTQGEIIEYLFKPSFSTADKITDLSGRGVGLDVVKTKIETLGGTVEVFTEMGKGSRFVIRMPLSLAIIQALLVFVGIEKYAIPINTIKQIVRITQEDIKLVQKQEVIILRDTIIPVIRLADVLGAPPSSKNKKHFTVVIVKKGDKLSGFMVDSLIGQQEIVIKSLGKLMSGIKSIAGATILGDGNVALILDVNSLT